MTESTKLAAMRDEASDAFENGDFLKAARRFVDVLLENPTCAKANFNLAVILQTMGACTVSRLQPCIHVI